MTPKKKEEKKEGKKGRALSITGVMQIYRSPKAAKTVSHGGRDPGRQKERT